MPRSTCIWKILKKLREDRDKLEKKIDDNLDDLEKKYNKQTDKVKTDASQKKYQDELSDQIKHTKLHKQNLERVFDVHQHLQKAKDVMVHVLSQHTGGLKHEIKGQSVKPEGFVVNHEGQLSKFNDRNEFNRLNRLARAK